MKSSYALNLFIKSVLFGLAFAVLTSCTPKKSDSTPANVARGARDGVFNEQGAGGGDQSFLPRGGYQPKVGVISQNSNDLNIAVQGLVSATMDPANLGFVDPNDGVRFQGLVDFNPANGSINFSNTKLLIEVWDEYAKDNSQNPYPVSFSSAQEGYIRSNGEVSLLFKDSYGSISIQGVIGQNGGQSLFNAQVFYQNAKTVDGNGLGSGTLGTFTIPTCSFFACP
jgi:hypothetical protein